MKKINKLILLLVAMSISSLYTHAQEVKGKGGVVTKTIDLSAISAIGLGISADVYISSGSSQKVEVRGQENIINLLNKKAKNGSWEIVFERGYNIKSYEELEIYITLPELEAISIGGSGSVMGKNKFNIKGDLSLSIGGSGDIKLDVEADDVKCNIGGSGTIKLLGSASSLKVSIGGSGDVLAGDLAVKECYISSAGSGDVKVHAADKLNVTLVGSGDVRYKGRPKLSKSIVGSGSVRPI